MKILMIILIIIIATMIPTTFKTTIAIAITLTHLQLSTCNSIRNSINISNNNRHNRNNRNNTINIYNGVKLNIITRLNCLSDILMNPEGFSLYYLFFDEAIELLLIGLSIV